MKTIKTTSPKALIAGFMLAGLLMTGCSGNNEGNGGNSIPAPSATASATETAAPTATGTPQPTSTYKNMQEATQEDKEKLLAGFAAKPLGVDVDEVMENRLADDVIGGPNNYTEAEVKAGITSALNTYQELASITAWTHARNGAEDATLIAPFGEATKTRAAFSAEMMNQFDTHIANVGRFSFGVSTVAVDGTVKLDGVVYQTDESSLMTSKSNQPGVSIAATGEMLHIEGTRYYTISLADDKTLIGVGEYHFDEAFDRTSGVWVIERFGEAPKSIKVVSDAEAAAWFAKAGTDG